MEQAKSAVQGFLHKNGKDDTTVHESTNDAVQHEHVTRTQRNESQTAVDREVHQDHHHTTVQPVKDHEVLPEQHTHKMAPVEHRTFEHNNDEHTRARLEKEQAQFQNTKEVGQVHHSHDKAATVGGEHVHHHVHENIQPVIQKETVQPSVVHTTQPVHEVHHNEAKHHGATTLPAVSMGEFQSKGGALGGSEAHHDAFAGAPNSNPQAPPGTIGGHGAQGTTHLTEKDGHHHGGNVATAGHVGNGIEHKKPSLMDKLNPKKDADGDGKAGFMD